MIPFAYSLPLFVSSIFFVRSFVRYLSLDLSNYCLLTRFTAERYYCISKQLFQQYEDIHTRIHIEALSQITMKNPSEATFWSVNTFSVTASALDGNLLLSCFWHFVENIPTCEGYIFQWQSWLFWPLWLLWRTKMYQPCLWRTEIFWGTGGDDLQQGSILQGITAVEIFIFIFP